MKKYLLLGFALAVLELLFYKIGFTLGMAWYSQVNRIEEFPDFCAVRDAIGNCLDFPWHTFVTWLGLFGVKIVVAIVFVLLLFRQKKTSNAAPIVAGYSIFILPFYLGLIPLNSIQELEGWLGMGSILGILSASLLVMMSVVTAGAYSLYTKYKK